jgi:hypothetical protein
MHEGTVDAGSTLDCLLGHHCCENPPSLQPSCIGCGVSKDSPAMRHDLLELLKTKALRVLDTPIQLASGEWSEYFIDGKEALASMLWVDLRLVRMLWQLA